MVVYEKLVPSLISAPTPRSRPRKIAKMAENATFELNHRFGAVSGPELEAERQILDTRRLGTNFSLLGI